MQDVGDGQLAEEVVENEKQPRQSAADRIYTPERIAALAFGAALIGYVFYYLQFSTDSICCGDFDGYYHTRWSRLLWEGITSGSFPPRFVWLPLTTLNPADYVDHHFLFHVLQIPFTWFGDLRAGAKWGAWFFTTLGVLSCYWLIVRYRISYAPVWLIALLACSGAFLYRMNMTKAMGLSIVFMIAGIYVLFERKYLWLALLGFLYVWTYSMWVMLPVATVIWTLVILWSERRFEWRAIVWTAVGCSAGLLINPYFPANIYLFYEHVVMKVRASDFTTKVGNEWYPYESWEFLINCFIAFGAMVAGYIAFDSTDKNRAQKPLFFLVFSTVLLLMNARWRRSVEYWPPFAVIFAAFAIQALIDRARSSVGRLPSDVIEELQPYLDAHTGREEIKAEQSKQWDALEAAVVGLFIAVLIGLVALRDFRAPLKAALVSAIIIVALGLYYYLRRDVRRTAVAIISFALAVIMTVNVYWTHRDIAGSSPHNYYRGGIEWMQANIPEGEMVFNTDWDDFPRLFYFDTRHRYVSGLDPTYLLDENPELAQLHERIAFGNEPNMAQVLRERFNARYVFTDNEEIHDKFYNEALNSGWFDRVYMDDECTILRVRDQRGEPPPEHENDGEDSDPNDN
jgi:hypothetical protein